MNNNNINPQWIYVYEEPVAHQGIFEIGMTTRTVEQRNKEKRSLHKWKLKAKYAVADALKAEKEIINATSDYRFEGRKEILKINWDVLSNIIEPITEKYSHHALQDHYMKTVERSALLRKRVEIFDTWLGKELEGWKINGKTLTYEKACEMSLEPNGGGQRIPVVKKFKHHDGQVTISKINHWCHSWNKKLDNLIQMLRWFNLNIHSEEGTFVKPSYLHTIVTHPTCNCFPKEVFGSEQCGYLNSHYDIHETDLDKLEKFLDEFTKSKKAYELMSDKSTYSEDHELWNDNVHTEVSWKPPFWTNGKKVTAIIFSIYAVLIGIPAIFG